MFEKGADKLESFLGKNSNFRGEWNPPLSSIYLWKIIVKSMGMFSFLKMRFEGNGKLKRGKWNGRCLKNRKR